VDRAVYRLAVSNGALLVAGDFTTIGGVPAERIAEWNGTEWKAYNLSPAAHVYAVMRNDAGELFAGGAFPGGVARWTGAGWEPVGGGVSLAGSLGMGSGVVSDFTMHRGDLYVTGCFSHVNGGSTSAQSVARWTGGSWQSLDDGSKPLSGAWFEWRVCGDEPNEYTVWDMKYQRLFSDGDRLFLGGFLPGAAGVPSQSIVSYDGEAWKALGEPEQGLVGYSGVIATGGPGNSAYVLGGITHAGKTPATSGIFRYDNGWTAIGGPLPRDVRCSHLAVDPSGGVFVGCDTPVGPGQASRPRVFRQQGQDWIQLPPLELEGILQDMRVDRQGRLWIAGGVRTGDASGSGFLARLDGDRFTVVENGFNSMVFRIAFPPVASGDDEMLVAGAFTQIGSGSFARIARWRGGSWQPLGVGFNTGVTALAWAEDAIYAANESVSNPAIQRFVLARWDGGQWVELATPESGVPPPQGESVHQFRDLLALGRNLIAAGSINPETGGRHVFVFDGMRLAPLAGGIGAIAVDRVALGGDGLWFTGLIAEAGSGDERTPSIGIAHFGLKD
jgi:hypothetical protein